MISLRTHLNFSCSWVRLAVGTGTIVLFMEVSLKTVSFRLADTQGMLGMCLCACHACLVCHTCLSVSVDGMGLLVGFLMAELKYHQPQHQRQASSQCCIQGFLK